MPCSLFFELMKIHLVSLGCPRNLVDSEIMLGRLLEAGHTITSGESDADCVVINTCSFIRPAVDESIDMILEMEKWKQQAEGRRLIVVGCLPQRYGKALVKTLPEVDVFLGTGGFDRIVEGAEDSLDGTRLLLPPPSGVPPYHEDTPRLRTTPPHTAYLKIAEGCSARCTYCIIPKLRGPHRSRPLDEVLSEARAFAEAGVKELILIAQNTGAYGHDLGEGYSLEHLLEKLVEIPSIQWIRVLYGHPDHCTDSLIQTIAAHETICSYFDIPIQHISESILKRMGRTHSSAHILDMFERIREKMAGAALRTTLIVGFPGETEHDFQCLLDLIEKVRFDHLGAFVYSAESDLPSNSLKEHVEAPLKKQRYDRLMSRQAELSRQNNQKYVGQILRVLVEGTAKDSDRLTMGRAAFQAPDIDGVIYFDQGSSGIGTFVNVKITQAHDYDLTGHIV